MGITGPRWSFPWYREGFKRHWTHTAGLRLVAMVAVPDVEGMARAIREAEGKTLKKESATYVAHQTTIGRNGQCASYKGVYAVTLSACGFVTVGT